MTISEEIEAFPPPEETTRLLQPQEAPSNQAIKYDEQRVRSVAAFVLALVCCGCANSITLFSMFAPGFQHQLGYSLLEINNISIAASLGMYLPVPILGYIADRKGPGILAIVSIVLFTPAYYISALLSDPSSPEEAASNYRLLTAAFAFIGTGTSALYFSGVITCARVFSKSPGLAISTPVAFYGLSSLWQSQVIQRFFFTQDGEIKLSQSFKFFAILYFFTGCISFAGTRIGGVTGGSQETEVVAGEPLEEGVTTDGALKPSTSDEEAELGTIAESFEDMIYKRHETVGQFLQDHTAWVLFAAFVLSSGPLEMYLNNIGMILSTEPKAPTVSTHVSLFSAFSTIARLSMGVVSDFLQDKISRPTLFAAVLYATAVIHYLTASGLFTIVENAKYFFVSSSSNGFAYGTVYTLTPTIIACTWGVENLGTHWGLFIIGPAIGSSGFGFLFARIYDAASSSVSNLFHAAAGDTVRSCTGLACYKLTFLITGSSILVSGLLISLVWLFAWKPSRH